MCQRLVFSALALASTLFFSCKKQRFDDTYYERIAQYVSAFTSGDISRNETIRVRFSQPAVSSDQVGKPAPTRTAVVSPSLDADLIWEDEFTLAIKPKKPLKSEKNYKAKVDLGRIFPDTEDELLFQFRARPLDIAVETRAMQYETPGDPSTLKLQGALLCSDVADHEAVSRVLKATHNGKRLNISWKNNRPGAKHEFEVLGIARGAKRGQVVLEWDGVPLDIKTKGETRWPAPALDEFIALKAEAVQAENPYISIALSDPLSADQSAAGLIRLTGDSRRLNFASAGSQLLVYLNNLNAYDDDSDNDGELTLEIEPGLRNSRGMVMTEASSWPLTFEALRPGVRLVGQGVILPRSLREHKVLFPFEAAGLDAVDLEVFKIYNNNILRFLQSNDLEGDSELERVGKIVLQKKISLSELNPRSNRSLWQRYALDLEEITHADPGAIYQVRLLFRREYANNLNCRETFEAQMPVTERDQYGSLKSLRGGYKGIYYKVNDQGWYDYDDEDGDYDWSKRNSPCAKEYYYDERFVSRNVFVSDMGLMAKQSPDGPLWVFVTDLNTATPMGGVDLTAYDYQLQVVGKGRTDSKGMAQFDRLIGRPYIIAGVRSEHRGFLRIADGASLPLSRFEADGIAASKGLKGYLYGERGVWRPGDSMYLHFVLEDREGKLPPNHPLTFELRDARGALRHRTVLSGHVGGVYPLHCATAADAPTGAWTAKVLAGGATFTRTLRVETVKPNRLKLDLDFGKKALYATDERVTGRLHVRWLHGALAQNMRVNVEMQLTAVKTTFEGLRNFVFDDPARDFYSEPQVIYDAYLDAEGQTNVPLEMEALNDQAPGKLSANFRVRAFESGGDFSTDYFTLDYFPYPAYVGVAIPQSNQGEKSLDRDGGAVQFAMVDTRGKPLANREILVGLYRTDWRWWWEEGAQSGVYQYNSAEHHNAIETATLRTNAQGVAIWKIKPQGWGRYLVRASDPAGGHAAGDFFWSGYPRHSADMQGRHAAAMLAFNSNKKSYQIGEEVTLNIPGGERSQILLTLENGSKVIERRWYDAHAGDNAIRFKTQAAMAPAVYAHVTLIQPYANTANDLPIRMYGVIPIEVVNPASRLQPRIAMPDAVKPDETFEVKISESSGKACTYTLAIVDEGLLDLTRFKTPDPNEVFNAREALRIKTWDVYDHVLGAYGTELERLLSTGGDGFNTKARNNAQANRYKPVVKHLGPFRLEKGKIASHKLKIENYIGSVRVMAVCSAPNPGYEGAYGSADKTVAVRKALMVQATLPRVLAPGETLRLPVEVFAMDKKVQSANIQLKTEGGKLRISGPSTLSFSQPGSKIAYFDVQTGDTEGVVKITATAQGGGESASHTVEIMIQNPNPDVSQVIAREIAPGATWSPIVPTSLFSKIKNAVVELSVLPAINLDRHLDYLIQYPHGCLEQIVSSAFPQLFVSQIAPLNDKQKDRVTQHVSAAIEKLRNYQLSDGSFSYWPGASQINNYSDVYAGHFLLEAKQRGYALPEGMLEEWLKSQTALSARWSLPKGEDYQLFDSENVQAYRLYALALAGKPDMAGMNRLRERGALYRSNAGLLANAYALAGKKEAAREVLASPQLADWRYEWYGATLGNDLRDKALMLETQVLLGNKTRAKQLLEEVCRELGGDDTYRWNTQSLAVALRALGRYAADSKGETAVIYSYAIDAAAFKKAESNTIVGMLPLSANASKAVIKNLGQKPLYARLIVRGQARMQQDESATQNHIALQVRFTDLKGAAIDPARIPRGTDFIAEFTVNRDSEFKFAFNQLALTKIFPSGWEIVSGRLSNITYGASSQAEYQDVRDDRVLTYFSIPDQSGTRTYRVQLNAAYPGRYYLPMSVCEAMYDNRIRAVLPGRWIEVI